MSFPSVGNGQEDDISYSFDVRPILSDLCFTCHGPDSQHRAADLRLDTEEGIRQALRGEGKAGGQFWERICSQDPDLQMPPPHTKKQVTSKQLEILQKWIQSGAPWEDHWAWQRSPKPPLSYFSNASALRGPIDSLIQEVLAKHNRVPSEIADRTTLIRRLSLDLRGLPPSMEEIEAFLSDSSPNAYEKLVDAFLASPSFGERMAWDWLDAARYADTNGYQGDNERTMWPWRDWVVRAMNNSMPLDHFTVWQLAGDLLPEASHDQKLATGFLRNHMINGEGGRIAEENRIDYAMDMTETVGTVWLGLTLNCCRCHDHKFDPIKQKEYYQLLAFFNQTPVDGGGGNPQTAPILACPTSEQEHQLKMIQTTLDRVQKSIQERREMLKQQLAEWETRYREQSPWYYPKVLSAKADHQQCIIEENQSILIQGSKVDRDVYQLELEAEPGEFVGIRIDALQHASLTALGLSRADSGNFVLTDIHATLQHQIPDNLPASERLVFREGRATFEQPGHAVGLAIDDQAESGWAVWDGKKVDANPSAYFLWEKAVTVRQGDRLRVVMKFESPHAHHQMGYFRIALGKNRNLPFERNDGFLESGLSKKVGTRTQAERKAITDRSEADDSELSELQKSQKRIESERKQIQDAIAKVMVMEDRKEPRKTHLLMRGLYNQPSDEVQTQVPERFPALPDNAPRNRLGLAQWLVDDNHPLTSRVLVNRYWQQLFGIGLIKTVEDFGSQGEYPLYFKLLNWLATDLQDHEWDTKRWMREVVMSHAYQQSSHWKGSSEEDGPTDPENRWLARGPRFRMPSWMIRDQALALSGLAVHRQGGPGVRPYQPNGVWEEASFGNKKYVQDRGESLYRRSLYTFWRRIVAPTMFFDNASRQVCTVKSVRTNTPLQSLYLLNDQTFRDASLVLAWRVLDEPLAEESERVDWLYRHILLRMPTSEERQRILNGVRETHQFFLAHPQDAKDWTEVESLPWIQSTDRIALASWSSMALALLNLDETLTKE